MPRRRKLFRLNLKKESLISVSSILLILLSVLTLLSFFAQSAMGSFFIQELVNRFFGWGAVLFPFILATIGLLFFKYRPRFITANIPLGLSIFTLSFLGLVHLLFFRGRDSAELAFLGQGGGLIGFWLSDFLKRYFSVLGALFIFLSTLIISALIFFNTSL